MIDVKSHWRAGLTVLAFALMPLPALLRAESDGVLGKAPAWKLYAPTAAPGAEAKPAAEHAKQPEQAPAADRENAAESPRLPAGDDKKIDWARAWSEGLPEGMELPSAPPPGARSGKGGKYMLEDTRRSPQMDPGKARARVIYGIAAQYADDKGLEKDPNVVVKYDFDDGKIRYAQADDWCGTPWASVSQLTREEAVSGDYCLLNRWGGTQDGGTASRWFLERLSGRERRVYFMRLYNKFDENWFGEGKVFGMKGFGFVGYAIKSGNTVPCDGKNWFTCEMQWTGWGPSEKPGSYKGLIILGHAYSYSTCLDRVQPSMNDEIKLTDNPAGGKPYRFSAYTPPYTYLQLGEWYCYEVGILLNTPGKSDGEACFWLNGRLETRVTHLRYFDVENLFRLYATINQYRTQTDNTGAAEVSRYVDNLVVARRYIGPIRFSAERLQYFRNRGIVVHVEDSGEVEEMRRARAEKPVPAVPPAKKPAQIPPEGKNGKYGNYGKHPNL